MFNKEFYPTPVHVLDMMGIDCYNKVVLEPSAGKGDIVDYCKSHGAHEIISCEKHPDLRKILSDKCRIISDDFFKVTSDHVSHVNMIVMNPPFSNADRHILHAWEIAPEGCEIIALCNWQTVDNNYHSRRRELCTIISSYGESTNLGDCFTNAERKTGVEIGLVRLFKPVTASDFDYDGFFFAEESEQQGNGIMRYDEIRALVNGYVAAVNCYDKFSEVSAEMNRYTDAIGFFGGFTFCVSYNETVSSKGDFAKALQKHCWKHVFNKMNIGKIVTKGVMNDINKFIENRQNYPFTMRNIYRMIEIIIGTREQLMNRAIIEAIDRFTQYTHENRYSVEGWKTNSGYMLNRKFISGWISEGNFSGSISIKSWGGNFEYLTDLTKALCYLTGTDFNNIPSIEYSPCRKDAEGNYILEPERYPGESNRSPVNRNRFEPNTWYEWGFFEFKVFKKGTGHFKFKDEKVWELINRAYAKIKGQVLPEKMKAA